MQAGYKVYANEKWVWSRSRHKRSSIHLVITCILCVYGHPASTFNFSGPNMGLTSGPHCTYTFTLRALFRFSRNQSDTGRAGRAPSATFFCNAKIAMTRTVPFRFSLTESLITATQSITVRLEEDEVKWGWVVGKIPLAI